MTSARSKWPVACALALVTAVALLYTAGLRDSPPYLMHDELQFSLQARSIATTGRDLAGRRFPVFFSEPEFPAGRDPAIIYATAVLLRVVPFSETGVRLPTAIVGVINVVLMFFVGRALFGSVWGGLLAAALLALTPIHFIRSRLVLSPFYAIPFILGWLLTLAHYLRAGSRQALLAGTACLALSAYTYLACIVMAPVYFAITLVMAWRREGRAVVVPMAATAAILLAPMVLWYATHPERYQQLIDAYRLYGTTQPDVVTTAVSASGPRLWVGLLWQFFSPDFLFLSGDSSLVNSTRTAGLFPITFAVLIGAGAWAALRSTEILPRVMLAGLVTAPLAGLLSGAIEMNRIMFVIPFGAAMAAFGGASLLRRGGGPRALAILLLAAVPLQFAAFHHGYLREYPARAGAWFGGNVRGALLEAKNGAGPIYVSDGIPFVDRYWAFYGAGDQPARDLRLFREPPGDAPVGARAACVVAEPACVALQADARWQRVAGIRELSGQESFQIFERR